MMNRHPRAAAGLFVASAAGLWALSWVFPERVLPWVRLATGLPWPPYLPPDVAGLALIGLHALQAGSYVWALWACARAGAAPSWRAIAGVAALCAPLYLLSGSLLSADAYLYTGYGHMAWLGLNPYLHSPAEFPRDPVIVPLAWWQGPTPYGPAWTALWTAVAWLAGAGAGARSAAPLLGGLLLARALALGAYAAGVWLLWRLGDGSRWAAWAFAWNPLVLQEALGNGRVDVPFAVLLVLAVWLARRRRWLGGALALGVAMAMRFTAIVFAPLYVCEAFRERRDWRRAGGVALAAAGVLALSYAPYWAGPATLGGLEQAGFAYDRKSGSGIIFALLSRALPGIPAWSGWAVAGVLFAGLVAFWLVRSRARLAATATLAYVLYLLLVSPHSGPWYAVWPVAIALAASAQDERERPGPWLWTGAGLSIWGLGLYQIWQFGQWDVPDSLRVIYVLALLAWPLALLARQGLAYFNRAPTTAA